MNNFSIGRFGLAFGIACAVIYLGCAFLMLVLPHEAAIAFFNSLMHGIDVSTIMRWDMPWWEMCLGVIQTFILGWFFGTLIASIYNVTAPHQAARSSS